MPQPKRDNIYRLNSAKIDLLKEFFCPGVNFVDHGALALIASCRDEAIDAGFSLSTNLLSEPMELPLHI